MLDHRLWNIILPPHISPGDQIIVKAPLIVHMPKAAAVKVPVVPRREGTITCTVCTLENSQELLNCVLCRNPLNIDTVSAMKILPSTRVLELNEIGNEEQQTKTYYVKVPKGVKADDVFQVLLDNCLWTVLCPDEALAGDNIVVTAPDPKFYADHVVKLMSQGTNESLSVPTSTNTTQTSTSDMATAYASKSNVDEPTKVEFGHKDSAIEPFTEVNTEILDDSYTNGPSTSEERGDELNLRKKKIKNDNSERFSRFDTNSLLFTMMDEHTETNEEQQEVQDDDDSDGEWKYDQPVPKTPSIDSDKKGITSEANDNHEIANQMSSADVKCKTAIRSDNETIKDSIAS
jgi:hypothetical protein